MNIIEYKASIKNYNETKFRKFQDPYLYHHGIKGQKWGIRRYQNEDNTLTEEGKKRYKKELAKKALKITAGIGTTYGAIKLIKSFQNIKIKNLSKNGYKNNLIDEFVIKNKFRNIPANKADMLFQKNNYREIKEANFTGRYGNINGKAIPIYHAESDWPKILLKEIKEIRDMNIDEYYSSLGCHNSLTHHGIMGQKWGIRKYQNEDGSLTPAGKERYGEIIKKAKTAKKQIEGYREKADSNESVKKSALIGGVVGLLSGGLYGLSVSSSNGQDPRDVAINTLLGVVSGGITGAAGSAAYEKTKNMSLSYNYGKQINKINSLMKQDVTKMPIAKLDIKIGKISNRAATANSYYELTKSGLSPFANSAYANGINVKEAFANEAGAKINYKNTKQYYKNLKKS